jgi:hypothetical protein
MRAGPQLQEGRMAAQPKTTARKRANTETPAAQTAPARKRLKFTPVVGAPPAPAVSDPRGKLGAVVALLRRPDGASLTDMMAATGWQAHSVRGAMSGALKKKLGLAILSEKTDAGRTYRIAPDAAA